VVLVHGYTAPASSWALTSDALIDAGYRVVTFDRRSTGDSESPMFGQRMARHGRDIGELLDHLTLDDVTLVGASMGGNAIWAYVDQFGSGRLRGVVIVDHTEDAEHPRLAVRVLLVGDSAHIHSPAGGQGMNYAEVPSADIQRWRARRGW
jgi:pimeloyl-ACP methyl ester carboxylesterase